MKGAPIIVPGPVTVFYAPVDTKELGDPAADERWQLLWPSVPDQPPEDE